MNHHSALNFMRKRESLLVVTLCIEIYQYTRGLVGLIDIACKHAFDAFEKESILLCKNGLWCSESVKDR